MVESSPEIIYKFLVDNGYGHYTIRKNPFGLVTMFNDKYYTHIKKLKLGCDHDIGVYIYDISTFYDISTSHFESHRYIVWKNFKSRSPDKLFEVLGNYGFNQIEQKSVV